MNASISMNMHRNHISKLCFIIQTFGVWAELSTISNSQSQTENSFFFYWPTLHLLSASMWSYKLDFGKRCEKKSFSFEYFSAIIAICNCIIQIIKKNNSKWKENKNKKNTEKVETPVSRSVFTGLQSQLKMPQHLLLCIFSVKVFFAPILFQFHSFTTSYCLPFHSEKKNETMEDTTLWSETIAGKYFDKFSYFLSLCPFEAHVITWHLYERVRYWDRAAFNIKMHSLSTRFKNLSRYHFEIHTQHTHIKGNSATLFIAMGDFDRVNMNIRIECRIREKK